MSDFKIISDSSCDLSLEFLEKFDVDIVPYFVTTDLKTYKKELLELKIEEFYEELRDKSVHPKTSLPPIQDYIDVFEKSLKEGFDIICICLTSKFSGSFQSANNAKEIILEKYPDRKIEVVDSLLVTGLQGLYVHEAYRMKKAGLSMEKIVENLKKLSQNGTLYFTVDSLEYLRRGGRIGQVSAIAGSLLNIKPIITMIDGELVPIGKIRGRSKALKQVISHSVKYVGDEQEKYNYIYVHADSLEDLDSTRKTLEDKGLRSDFPNFMVGATIGTHAGPSSVAVCILKKYEFL